MCWCVTGLASRALPTPPTVLSAGDLPETSGDFPVRPEWEKDWSPKTGVCLESAYKQVDGKEPDFTNNAKVRRVSGRRFPTKPLRNLPHNGSLSEQTKRRLF